METVAKGLQSQKQSLHHDGCNMILLLLSVLLHRDFHKVVPHEDGYYKTRLRGGVVNSLPEPLDSGASPSVLEVRKRK